MKDLNWDRVSLNRGTCRYEEQKVSVRALLTPTLPQQDCCPAPGHSISPY